MGVHPTEVDCFYQFIMTPDGETLVHLSTFGSDSRASVPKSSQSMQVDRRAAEALIRVIKQAFPDLEV